LFKARYQQKSVVKQSAFSSSWQAAVGWLRTVCWFVSKTDPLHTFTRKCRSKE